MRLSAVTLVAVFVPVVLSLGCDDPDPVEDEPRACAQRAGTYELHFVETSGTCGPRASAVTAIEEQPETPEDAGCMGGAILYSDDNCTVTNVDIVCPGTFDGEPVNLLQNAEVVWSEDGTYGLGWVEIVVQDDNGEVCASVYELEGFRV